VSVVARSRREHPPIEPGPPQRILLASEGREISNAAIARVVELAKPWGASVHVLSIARVHGVAFGLPNPGLLPTKREWDEQREMVRKVVGRLRRKGLEADGHVLGTRNATKRILAEAAAEHCDAIVMCGDPDRGRFVSDFMWTQEPQRVRRKAKVPVYIVVEDPGTNQS
jgi:nucleotide-binding universal stress UspA family protein